MLLDVLTLVPNSLRHLSDFTWRTGFCLINIVREGGAMFFDSHGVPA